jgi:hypothetical protein
MQAAESALRCGCTLSPKYRHRMNKRDGLKGLLDELLMAAVEKASEDVLEEVGEHSG